jgi:hypothetical protein
LIDKFQQVRATTLPTLLYHLHLGCTHTRATLVQDERVKEALNQGVNLREYTAQTEAELYKTVPA